MKLPEYNNQSSNTPLYSSKLPEPEGDFKFTAMVIGYPLLFVGCIGLIIYGLFW